MTKCLNHCGCLDHVVTNRAHHFTQCDHDPSIPQPAETKPQNQRRQRRRYIYDVKGKMKSDENQNYSMINSIRYRWKLETVRTTDHMHDQSTILWSVYVSQDTIGTWIGITSDVLGTIDIKQGRGRLFTENK
eukprot:184541_1